MQRIRITGFTCASARHTIDTARELNDGWPISIGRAMLVVTEKELNRLTARGASFGMLYEMETRDRGTRIATIPVP